MKSVGQPAETAHEDYAALADQFLQGNEYLPPRGDQSWREQAALHIAGSHEQHDDDIEAGDALDMVPVREEADFGATGGHRGRILIPLLMAMVIVPIIAVLTAPDILTAGFWRGHQTVERPPAAPAAPPVRMANIPAPLRASLAKAPPPPIPAPPVPAKEDPDLTAAANPPPEIAPTPKARPDLRTAEVGRPDNGSGGGFRSLVIGPDGTFKYEYFSSEPSVNGAGGEQARDDSGDGFYAMVPDPDGTLRYKYFPSKPPH